MIFRLVETLAASPFFLFLCGCSLTIIPFAGSMFIHKKVDKIKKKMTRILSELPISQTIFDAEKKHGIDTHMVIECISRQDIPEENNGEELEDSVYWWVEFENEIKTFQTFDEVQKFLLDDAVSEGSKWFEKIKKLTE
jgi:hypothetical protein